MKTLRRNRRALNTGGEPAARPQGTGHGRRRHFVEGMGSGGGREQEQGQIEGEFCQQADGSAAVTCVALQASPDEDEEDGDGEDGGEDGQPPCDIGEEQQRQRGEQALQGQTDGGSHADGPVDGLVLGFFLASCIGHEIDYLTGQHLGQWVACQDGKDGCHGGQGGENAHQQQEVEDEGDDSIGADVGVFHDGECALSRGTSAEAIEEVGQSIFVEGTREEEANDNGKDDCDGERQDVASPEECECHDATCQPADERPMFNHCGIGFLGWLTDAPERKTGEEDEGGKYIYHLTIYNLLFRFLAD